VDGLGFEFPGFGHESLLGFLQMRGCC
jgi:hypothetical protein